MTKNELAKFLRLSGRNEQGERPQSEGARRFWILYRAFYEAHSQQPQVQGLQEQELH